MSAYQIISATAPPARGGRFTFLCTALSPRQRQKNSTSRSKRFATVSTDVTWGVKIVLWIMVVFRISIGKKYAARITVIIKQFLNHLFSRHRERNPNSDSTIPTAGRI